MILDIYRQQFPAESPKGEDQEPDQILKHDHFLLYLFGQDSNSRQI